MFCQRYANNGPEKGEQVSAISALFSGAGSYERSMKSGPVVDECELPKSAAISI
jgi:hypothetical protein